MSGDNGQLPAYFWHNVSESRRRRLRARTRRRAAQAGFFGGIAGCLMTLGVLHSNVTQLFWGAVLFLSLCTYLLLSAPPKRRR